MNVILQNALIIEGLLFLSTLVGLVVGLYAWKRQLNKYEESKPADAKLLALIETENKRLMEVENVTREKARLERIKARDDAKADKARAKAAAKANPSPTGEPVIEARVSDKQIEEHRGVPIPRPEPETTDSETTKLHKPSAI